MALLPSRIEHDGLVMRLWRADDVEVFHEAIVANVEHLRPWMPWIRFEPSTIEQRRELLATWEREHAEGGDAVYGIFDGGEVAGGCGLHHRIGPGGLEIGYWVHVAHLGRGIATRASAGLTDTAFTLAEIDRVEIHHSVANARSRRIPERLGYQRHEDRLVERDRGPSEIGPDGIWRLTRDQWESRAPR